MATGQKKVDAEAPGALPRGPFLLPGPLPPSPSRGTAPRGHRRLVGLLILLCLSLVLDVPPLSASERVIRYGMMELPPLFFRGEEGRYEGYLPELLDLLAGDKSWQFSLVEGHGDDLLPMLERGELDLLSMAPTLALERRFDFAKNHHYATWYTFFTCGDDEILAFQDLEGKKLSIQGGFYALYELRRILDRLGVSCSIVETRTKEEAMELLERGDVDVWADEQLTTANVIRRNGFRRSPVIFAPSPILFATTKGKNGDLLAELDRRLALLQADPLSPLGRLHRRWFYDEEFTFFPRWGLWALGGGSLFLVLAVGGQIVFLRKERLIRQKNGELALRLSFQRFLSEAARALLAQDAFHSEEVLPEVCQGLGEVTGAERLLLLRGALSPDRRRSLEILFEGASPGQVSWEEWLEGGTIFVDDLPPLWLSDLSCGKVVRGDLGLVPLGEILPPSSGEGLLSIYPLWEGKRLWGALALQFDEEDLEAVDPLILTFAEMISSHLLHKRETLRLLSLARIDDLTKLPNRRIFFETLAREMARSLRHDSPLSVILCDIDLFKNVNDSYGHANGDRVLRRLARILRKTLRAEDLPCRVGGEEFAIVLPETLDRAALIAERLRAVVERTAFTVMEGERTLQISLTASFGVATFLGPDDDGSALFVRADQAMYEAKRRGRNCVCQDGQERETALLGG